MQHPTHGKPSETRNNKVPVVGVTIGDAAGIGPEVALKSVADPALRGRVRPVLIGDFELLRSLGEKLNLAVKFRAFDRVNAGGGTSVEIVDAGNLAASPVMGSEGRETGRAAGECIAKAVELCLEGVVDAIATAPISKASLKLGGFDFPGHTEFLASLTGTSEFAMSFVAGRLWVILLSTHLSLVDAASKVRRENLEPLIRFTSREIEKMLGRPVVIAVAGLNPHASEGGLFGSEEAEEIVPAIEACAAEGIDVRGPFAADTVFLRGFRGEFDAVIACYHDQATIAVKCLSFGAAVNVTIGLPLIRTSVDHGTAFDIAGKGIADASSMKAAIGLAGEMAALKWKINPPAVR